MSLPVFSSDVRCKDAEDLLDVYIDGEMDIMEARDLERHLEGCRTCADKEERRRHTRNLLRRTSGSLRVTADFQARLNEALRGASAVTALETVVASTPEPAAPSQQAVVQTLPAPAHARAARAGVRPWIAVGALAAAASIGVLASLLFAAPSFDDPSVHEGPAVAGVSTLATPMIAEAVDWHRRAVPIEVTGPNASTVGDWFAEKVSFAVSVPDLGRSVRLLGGRLSHVRHHEAAYILYEANGSKLSVMAFGDTSELPESLRRNGETFVDNSGGYNVAVHVRDGVTYTFTSNMEANALVELVERSFVR